MAYVEVLIREGAEYTLVGFPLLDGQYIEEEKPAENPEGEGWLVIVNLGDRQDTTTAQEQFLNASDDVMEYAVKDDLDEIAG